MTKKRMTRESNSLGMIPAEFRKPALKAIREVNSNIEIMRIGYKLNQTQLLRLVAPYIPAAKKKLLERLIAKPKRKRRPKPAPVAETGEAQ